MGRNCGYGSAQKVTRPWEILLVWQLGLVNSTALGNSAIVSGVGAVSDTMVFGNTRVVGWGFGVQPAGQHFVWAQMVTNGGGATLTLAGTWTSVRIVQKV